MGSLYFIMTVDADPPFSSKMDCIIENGLISLLNLFNRHSIKATFFVPAVVAEKFPKLMEKIAQLKHEIACHGLKHEPYEATLSFSEQVRNIKKATEIIEAVTGLKPTGFRAPLFKVNRNCWMALYKNQYVYDSSVVPSPLYGNYKQVFPKSKPYYIPIYNSYRNYGLLEIPVSVNPFLPFPLGGGWVRIFSLNWTKIAIKTNLAFNVPVVFYIHPKDVVDLNICGLPWYFYRNTTKSINILGKIIKYAKQCGAKFVTAYQLAKIIKNSADNCLKWSDF